MRVSIFGLGYVGAVTAGCLASRGHTIIGVDPQQAKVDIINAGHSPIHEPGLDELLSQGVAAGRISATQDAAAGVVGSEISVVCVGTPSAGDGSLDLTYVRGVASQIASAIPSKPEGCHRVVFRSTMLPGSVRALANEIFQDLRAAGRVELYFYPEFLREGSAIRDFDEPSLSVIGSLRPEAALAELDGFLEQGTQAVSLEVAEMVKYSCNAFHALKVTFANEIGRVARDAGVDGREVMRLLCADTKLNISSRYLRPGNPYGGSCLPKDVSALTYLGRARELDLPLLESLKPSNTAHLEDLEERILALGPRAVAFLGVAFKRNTDDLRGSPALELAARLVGRGIEVRVFDPAVNPAALLGANAAEVARVLPRLGSLMTTDFAAAVTGAEVIVASFACVAMDDLGAKLTASQTLFDLSGNEGFESLPCRVEGICW